MKNVFRIVLLFIIVISFTGCTNNVDGKKFKEDYEALNSLKNEDGSLKYLTMDLEEKNPIKYLSIEEVFDFFESGTGFIYIGRPACPWCRIAIPVMFDAAEQEELKTIYYYDIEQIRNSNTEDYKKLLEVLDEYLSIDTVTQSEKDQDFDPDLKRVVVPDFYSVKKGKIVKHHQNTVSSHKSYKDLLTEEQIEELLSIYKKMYESIK